MPTVQILHVPGCANLDLARERVQIALDRTGARGVDVVERVVDDEMSAAEIGMPGSPTVQVDGRDVDPSGDGGALSCRLYRTPTGVDGAPSVGAIVAALVASGG